MNEKEVRELRRRFRQDRSYISSVHGCYVNESRQVISMFEEALSVIPQDEAGRYLALLKKTLSGSLGKNLVDMEFSTAQVMDSDEHRLLSLLKNTGLHDEDALKSFYQRVIESVNMEGNYLILLAHDVYTVPYKAKDDTMLDDASDEEFPYFVCCICPVKQTQPALSYYSVENKFHSSSAGYVVSAPEVGFLFPAFDNRSANIYGALYYMKNAAENHSELINGLFHTDPPMPASAQKETFELLLADTLKEECSLEVIQSVHEQLSELIEQHKENKEEEPLKISKREIGTLLTMSGVSEEHIEAFTEQFDAAFGEDAALPPTNVIDRKKFEIKTPDVLIKVNPERSDVVETRIINGSKYILIAADGEVEVNGVSITIGE